MGYCKIHDKTELRQVLHKSRYTTLSFVPTGNNEWLWDLKWVVDEIPDDAILTLHAEAWNGITHKQIDALLKRIARKHTERQHEEYEKQYQE